MKRKEVKNLINALIFSLVGLNAQSFQGQCINLHNNSFLKINSDVEMDLKTIIINADIESINNSKLKNQNSNIDTSYLYSVISSAFPFLDGFKFSDTINILFLSFRNGYVTNSKTITLTSSPPSKDILNENNSLFSKSIFLHEFAHNVFGLTINHLLKNLFQIDNILKELDEKIFPNFFTPNYTSELNARYSILQNEISLISSSHFGNENILWSIIFGRKLSSFNELFADTLTILVENDLSAMSKALMDGKDVIYSSAEINSRNFDNFQLLKVDKSIVKLNEYNYFSDVRIWIGTYLKNNPKNRVEDGNLILKTILNTAIEIATDKNFKFDYLSEKDNMRSSNIKLIEKLNQVLKNN